MARGVGEALPAMLNEREATVTAAQKPLEYNGQGSMLVCGRAEVVLFPNTKIRFK
jgi:hypothetical protein